MPAKTADAGSERILHCSPARTVFERADSDTGEVFVCKLFVTGSEADAERELAMGRLARGPGVATYVELSTDAATARPCLSIERLDGIDCRQLVARRGAIAAAEACRLLQPVATTLARLHALRVAGAPAGLCHGDVKPQNLLCTEATTVLLDFEHAVAIDSAQQARFTGGTHDFSPPEASRGQAPDAGFDVFGLGATLRWLLAGGDDELPPQHDAVQALLRDCLSPAASERPTAASVATRLAALAHELETDNGERVLDDCLSGRFALDGTAFDGTDARGAHWRRLSRLLRRASDLLEPRQAQPTHAAAMLAELHACRTVLRRFPRHAVTIEMRRRIALAAGELVANAAQSTHTAIKGEDFDAAARALRELVQLVHALQPLPVGLPVPVRAGLAGVGLPHRDATAYLERLAAQVENARDTLESDLAVIRAAEQRLDLRAAERGIELLANRHGGASPSAAGVRDRLHRLTFYLERVARAEPNVERVAPMWDATALQPLTTFVATAAAARGSSLRDDAGSTVGLRSLQLILVNLAEEFPHLDAVAPALDALTDALAHVTDQAWQLLAETNQRLQIVPVPVRPLQLALARLDTFRILEAFVDRPSQPRSRLLDDIESLRLGFEQARATRDRLAENAEHAVARGHWTTGLFDMERAVAGLTPGDDNDLAEAARLHERLEEVRRKKQEVEARVRRNVDLAGRYAELQDEPSSTFAGRLVLLEERRDCLLFLTMRVPADRALLYRQDLYGVEIQIALERAALAEHELDSTVEPRARLQLARATVDQLSASMSTAEEGGELPGRLVRLLDHWRTLANHCQREVSQRETEQASARSHRYRMLAVTVIAFLVTTTAVLLAIKPWLLGQPASAAEKQDPARKH